MNQIKETIFNYVLSEQEKDVINPNYPEKASYLQFTSRLKMFSDLHLLFLYRKDWMNCERVADNMSIAGIAV